MTNQLFQSNGFLFLFVIGTAILSVYAILLVISKNRAIRLLTSQNLTSTNLLAQNNVVLTSIQKQLEESERFARIVRQSPNGIMMMDKHGNVLTVNTGFVDMYEYKYEEFIAVRGANYRKTSFSAEVTDRIDRIMRTKQPVKYEALNVTKSGKKLWTQTALVPVLDSEGDFDGMVTIDTDIHKRIETSDVLIEKMERINATIDATTIQFKRLSTETKSLFETINETTVLLDQTVLLLKFVKEISDNLKILGINASIEAHLAGSNGLGFRVVANEIVDISNKGLTSVAQIADLLNQVSEKQAQLLQDKHDSASALTEYQRQMKLLKSEIVEVENAISELKTLS